MSSSNHEEFYYLLKWMKSNKLCIEIERRFAFDQSEEEL